MTDSNEQEAKRPLSLARPGGGKLELKKLDPGQGQVRQSFSHGRSKPVTVEVKKKRIIEPPRPGSGTPGPSSATGTPPTSPAPPLSGMPTSGPAAPGAAPGTTLGATPGPSGHAVAAPSSHAGAAALQGGTASGPNAGPRSPNPAMAAPSQSAPLAGAIAAGGSTGNALRDPAPASSLRAAQPAPRTAPHPAVPSTPESAAQPQPAPSAPTALGTTAPPRMEAPSLSARSEASGAGALGRSAVPADGQTNGHAAAAPAGRPAGAQPAASQAAVQPVGVGSARPHAPAITASPVRPPAPNRDGSNRDGPNRDGPNRDGPNRDALRPGAKPGSPTVTLRRGGSTVRTLTEEERVARVKALQGSMRMTEEAKRQAEVDESLRSQMAEIERERRAEEEARRRNEEQARTQRAEDEKRRVEDEQRRVEEAAKQKAEDDSRREVAERAGKNAAAKVAALTSAGKLKGVDLEAEEATARRSPAGRPDLRRAPAPARTRGPADQRRRTGKLTISRALSSDTEEERTRSLAAVRRARERERMRQSQGEDQPKIVRDVVVPESITVQELAQRMAERGVDVIKALMRIGVMATLNQAIDADTAELIVSEFGHNLKRVAEADVEIGMKGDEDIDQDRTPRPPVVTIMGHVDHGKTSLLDALRHTDVVAGEAGGITQHIGAYQVTLPSGRKITFIDTPGHQAFTAMRARGAEATDIVVLVVAADDGIKEQTIEAIRHARASGAPMIVAINKIDRPGADPARVRQELLQHDVVVEEMGGDVLDVEVSALQKTNLDKLEEAILLQAEILDLRANPNRPAEGVIIEAKLERGRGPVATVLIKRGTLRRSDIFVAGGEWGKVRALVNDRGEQIDSALPGMPVEVLGLNGAPFAGDDFSVVENETRARDITEFRQRRKRDAAIAAGGRGTLEEMFSAIAAGAVKEMPVVVKSDVQGSLEAIVASLKALSTGEVAVRILHAAVGGINESDVNLARASSAIVIGFNVRANPQARDLAKRDGVDIRYYSIIYNVIDDVRAVMEGMLAPSLREIFLGNAQIQQVFEITKVGKVAGCRVTEGMVRRGAKVRLLRDNVVIHEGSLKTLKRFKDEVREVREGYECGMAFENYEDIREGDTIECFDLEEVARTLESPPLV